MSDPARWRGCCLLHRSRSCYRCKGTCTENWRAADRRCCRRSSSCHSTRGRHNERSCLRKTRKCQFIIIRENSLIRGKSLERGDFTFAVGRANLNSHVGRGQRRAEDESALGAGDAILVAARVGKGREGCRARRQLDVPSLRDADERERGDCGHERPEDGHCHGKP